MAALPAMVQQPELPSHPAGAQIHASLHARERAHARAENSITAAAGNLSAEARNLSNALTLLAVLACSAPPTGGLTPPTEGEENAFPVSGNPGTLDDITAASPKRKRGRPRKYEDLTEEERKERRAVDNRHAAKRSYYRRISKMSELEEVTSSLFNPHPDRLPQHTAPLAHR